MRFKRFSYSMLYDFKQNTNIYIYIYTYNSILISNKMICN